MASSEQLIEEIKAINELTAALRSFSHTFNCTTAALLPPDELPQKVLFKKLDANAQIPVRNGAAYDLFIPHDVIIEAGKTVKIGLGFACKLPFGWHALINMRSSTWKKWGLCLTNQTGIIDNLYCGNDDEWILSVYRPNSFTDYPAVVPAGTRLAQFRIVRDSPDLNFEIVDDLESVSRGGFGSTGQ